MEITPWRMSRSYMLISVILTVFIIFLFFVVDLKLQNQDQPHPWTIYPRKLKVSIFRTYCASFFLNK